MPQSESLLERVNKLINSGGLELPVYDPVALRLQQEVASGLEDVGEIQKLIETDQSLSAEVLRVANSPFYCGLSPVRTIRMAVVRLGMQQIRRLVILVSERERYKAHDAELDKLLGELWRHASTSGLAAEWLARRLHATGIEEICFLGGLLHDIGKLILLRAVDEMKRSEDHRDSAAGLISPALLNELLLTAHCQMGYTLLKDWNVPDVYCQIVRDHHSENVSAGDLPLTIVRLANEASKKLGMGLNPNPSIVLAATPEASSLKASEVLLAELEVMLEDHIAQAA